MKLLFLVLLPLSSLAQLFAPVTPISSTATSSGYAAQYAGLNVAIVGTSIESQGFWTSRFAQLSGMNLTNLGYSGGKYTGPGYEILGTVASIPINANVVLAGGGINDWGNNAKLGSPNDTDSTTYYGALYKLVTRILATNQQRLLVLITPYSPGTGNGYGFTGFGYNTAATPYTVSDLAQATIITGQRMGVPVIDISRSGIGATRATMYTSDKLHLTSSGGQVFADYVWSRLRELNPTPTVVPATFVSPVTFSPVSGTYSAAQSLTLTTSTTGATINFTTDGSNPTTASSVYANPIPISVSQTVKAFASKSGLTSSGVTTASYVLNTSVAAPTISPAAGTYTSAQMITIASATSGATSYYTTDGSNPTTSSTQYTAPFSLSITGTVKAISVKSGLTTSGVTANSYTFNIQAGGTIVENGYSLSAITAADVSPFSNTITAIPTATSPAMYTQTTGYGGLIFTTKAGNNAIQFEVATTAFFGMNIIFGSGINGVASVATYNNDNQVTFDRYQEANTNGTAGTSGNNLTPRGPTMSPPAVGDKFRAWRVDSTCTVEKFAGGTWVTVWQGKIKPQPAQYQPATVGYVANITLGVITGQVSGYYADVRNVYVGTHNGAWYLYLLLLFTPLRRKRRTMIGLTWGSLLLCLLVISVSYAQLAAPIPTVRSINGQSGDVVLPAAPTMLSQLSNDTGFMNSAQVSAAVMAQSTVSVQSYAVNNLTSSGQTVAHNKNTVLVSGVFFRTDTGQIDPLIKPTVIDANTVLVKYPPGETGTGKLLLTFNFN